MGMAQPWWYSLPQFGVPSVCPSLRFPPLNCERSGEFLAVRSRLCPPGHESVYAASLMCCDRGGAGNIVWLLLAGWWLAPMPRDNGSFYDQN
jgi:hypothetical protein